MDKRKKRIIEVSEEILNFLLDFKSEHPDFTFSLRSRESTQSKEQRLTVGQWFQGSDYLYVPLFRRGDKARKIKTIGFTIEFDRNGSITDNYISVSFKSGVYKDNAVKFHKEVADLLNIELNESNYGKHHFENPEKYLENLGVYVSIYRPKMVDLLIRNNLYNTGDYIISEEEFQSNLERINKIRKSMNKRFSFDKMEHMFKNYLQRVIPRSEKNYMSAVPTINRIGTDSGYLGETLYEIQNLKEYDTLMQNLEENDQYHERNRVGHGMFRASLKKYQGLLKELENSKESMKDTFIQGYIDLLVYKKQIILQGPPGTGKTFTAKNIAEKILFPNDSISNDKEIQKQRLEECGRFKLVQFHPSYSYEDFVRGITAKSIDGNVVYETENKVLASFAQMALENQEASAKDNADYSIETRVKELLNDFSELVQDQIDNTGFYKITEAVSIIDVEDDAFRYTGNWKTSQRMKFRDLIIAYIHGVETRQELRNTPSVSGLARQHASYFIKVLQQFKDIFLNQLKSSPESKMERPDLLPYVLVIDEINRANLPSVLGELIYALEYRNQSVKSIYDIDKDYSITIPENLLIIGTMNTADRSVGHIDYAIKRRFAFMDCLPDRNVISNPRAQDLFDSVSELFVEDKDGDLKRSNHLASDFDPKDVQIGHSYFMLKSQSEKEQGDELQLRLDYEILPLLHEYVKDGLLLESAKEKIEEIGNFEC